MRSAVFLQNTLKPKNLEFKKLVFFQPWHWQVKFQIITPSSCVLHNYFMVTETEVRGVVLTELVGTQG